MKTYRPNYSGSVKMLIVFMTAAYVAFVAGSAYIACLAVSAVIESPSPEAFAVLVLPAALLFAVCYWGSGTLDLFTSSFRITFRDRKLFFEYVGRPFYKQEEVSLDEVTDLGIAGHPKSGVWVTVQTKKRSHRLGHLLDPKDAVEIIETIKNEKEA